MSYKIILEEDKKAITIILVGNPKVDDVTAFHHEYIEKITPIQTSEYLLLLDAQQMSVPEPDRLHQMQVTFALYRKSGFQKIGMIMQDDTMRKQILKLVRFSGISEITDIAYITPDEREDLIQTHLEQIK